MNNLVSVGECEPDHHWLWEKEVGHCPLALAWSTGSEPSAYTLYLGYNKRSAEFVSICLPFSFLLFHEKNNRIVRKVPRSISRDNQRPQRAQNLLVLSNISCNWSLGLGKYGRCCERNSGYRSQAGGWNSQFLDSSTWIRAHLENKPAQNLIWPRGLSMEQNGEGVQSKLHNSQDS